MERGLYLACVIHFKKFYDLSFKEQAKRYELQMIDIHILLFLKNNPSLNTARDIVACRGLSKSNVSNALEKLRRRGLMRLEEDSENRRIQRIFLMPEGEAMALSLRETQTGCFERMLEGFSREERDEMDRSFRRIEANVTAALREL
ncbi:MAG: MarR family transcriptional regulator [Lachnospiraceae bacterium]|jgi:DNA-binding MarR family transcriptional regulator|nr:MarR family transcriptional regulator [Lachnospiraceae bacterium]